MISIEYFSQKFRTTNINSAIKVDFLLSMHIFLMMTHIKVTGHLMPGYLVTNASAYNVGLSAYSQIRHVTHGWLRIMRCSPDRGQRKRRHDTTA